MRSGETEEARLRERRTEQEREQEKEREEKEEVREGTGGGFILFFPLHAAPRRPNDAPLDVRGLLAGADRKRPQRRPSSDQHVSRQVGGDEVRREKQVCCCCLVGRSGMGDESRTVCAHIIDRSLRTLHIESIMYGHAARRNRDGRREPTSARRPECGELAVESPYSFPFPREGRLPAQSPMLFCVRG